MVVVALFLVPVVLDVLDVLVVDDLGGGVGGGSGD